MRDPLCRTLQEHKLLLWLEMRICDRCRSLLPFPQIFEFSDLRWFPLHVAALVFGFAFQVYPAASAQAPLVFFMSKFWGPFSMDLTYTSLSLSL